jgi:integrase
MKRKKGIKLQWHKGNAQWCKVIGKALGRDGKPKAKIWYFGTDEEEAIRQCVSRKAAWKALRAAGKVVWDEDPSYASERARTHGSGNGAAPVSVAEAVTAYLDELKAQRDAGQFTPEHYDAQAARLNKATRINIGTDASPLTLDKLPLSVVTDAQLSAVVLRLCARPEVCRPNGTPHRMSTAYARAVVKTLRAFADWCLDHDYMSPIKPKRYAKIWKARIVLTLEEQQAQLAGTNNEADHFTIDELCKLYAATAHTQKPDHWRCLILLGLNCAFANEEAASLKKSEVKASPDGGRFIERYRTKTIRFGAGAYAKWQLWPETVAQLDKVQAAQGDLVLTTDDGKRLTDNNAIGQGWERLTRNAGVRPLSFKFLRKTAAWLCRTLSDTDTAEMLLSHADKGVIKFYAARDWDGKLADALRSMRQKLQPMFDAQPKPLERSKPNAKLGRSGIRGVSYIVSKEPKPWRAYGKRDGKRITLGYFATKDEAVAAQVRNASEGNKAQETAAA